jgi:1-acyl-sn-glycerol-3-phosphate acyltransferase
MHPRLTYLRRSLFWRLSIFAVHTVIRSKFRFFITKGSEPLPPSPYIVVANHGTFFDPWIVGGHSPAPLSIMMNDDGFRSGALTRWYLRNIGAFPKKKGAHDFKAMKMTIQFLRSGYGVLIFPEGQTTWDGETQPIYGGIEKILKKVGCSLVIMRLNGNFLTKPWWAHTYRRGRVGISIKVLKPGQIAALSDEALLEAIRTGIYQNDVKDPANRAVEFRGKDLALGLERFVWMCMHCEAEDRLTTEGDLIRCEACGHVWRIDPWCRLTEENGAPAAQADLKDWSEWHKQKVKARLAAAENDAQLTHSDNVLLQVESEGRVFQESAKGCLRMSRAMMTFTPAAAGPQLSFPLSSITDYVFQRKDMLEFMCDSRHYRFVFDRHSPMKWLYYLRYLSGYEACEQRGVI